MTPIYTIGIGKREVADLIQVLKQNRLAYLIDVRSSPYSRHKPDFNREVLERTLESEGIRYAHWPQLGGFPESEHVLSGGHVDYGKLARTPAFRQALERLATASEADHRIVLLCSEGRPEMCHRSKCIGVELEKMQLEICHIDEAGIVRKQLEVMKRINADQQSLPGLEPPMRSKRKWTRENEDDEWL